MVGVGLGSDLVHRVNDLADLVGAFRQGEDVFLDHVHAGLDLCHPRDGLLDQLWEDSDHNHIMDATDGGLLPQLIGKGMVSEMDPSNSTLTPAKGAMWNALLAWTDDRPHWADGSVGEIHFGSHPNSGNGVHNPHLLEALLLASIGEVRGAYGLQ